MVNSGSDFNENSNQKTLHASYSTVRVIGDSISDEDLLWL